MSTSDWLVTIKPGFLNQLMALSPKEAAQVNKKLALLTEDPTPDAKVKKQLKYMGGKLHRLRCGDFRVFYTFESPYISVLSVVRRDDDTYSEDMDAEFLGGAAPTPTAEPTDQWARWTQPRKKDKTHLPQKVTKALLENMHIPEGFHDALVGIKYEEDLLDESSVPDEVLLRVHEAIVEKPLAEVIQQPDLVAEDVDDLLKFKSGDLLGFLLKLNPAQEKYVTWAKDAKGPTLLKGGPGTGKSTVALYRARTMLKVLRKRGVEQPRLLFSTYTNALVEFSRQLLTSLLGDDADCVEVRTADSLAMKLGGRITDGKKSASFSDQLRLAAAAVKEAEFAGNRLEQRAQRLTLERLPGGYLLEEFTNVIQGRGLADVEAYLGAPRPGRELRLNKTQRKAVWAAYEAFVRLLNNEKFFTFGQVRAAAAAAATSEGTKRYDGVIVDEAQDLDPLALRMLVDLAKDPSGLFLTADANQSIYGAAFRWAAVHESLKFTGRTGVLKTNHRSTREIDEAAHSYAGGGFIDDEAVDRRYVNSGPLPALRWVGSKDDETDLLSRFLPAAARDFGLALGSCAILCPAGREAEAIAQRLTQRGFEASAMSSRTLDLSRPGIKVLPLQAAKGLEFPVVAIAGFRGAYKHLEHLDDEQALKEALNRERRTLFVAMTRAMRALLVLAPEGADEKGVAAPLLNGFDEKLWNLGTAS